MSDLLGTNLAEVGTDCISRQQAIDIAKELTITIEGYEMHNQAVMDYCAEIMRLPPAEPERLKGEWEIKKSTIHPYGNDVCCSICGHTMGSTFGYKFCPMCGADMRGEHDG